MGLLLSRQRRRLYQRREEALRWENGALATRAARLPDLSRICLAIGAVTAGADAAGG